MLARCRIRNVGESALVVRNMGWYEHELGWPTAGTVPPGPVVTPVTILVTGVRFDVLDVPAEAGFEVLDLRRFAPAGATGPVVLDGRRMRLLVAAGSAEELPGLLDWLEWGGIPLDLTALGAGGWMPAPAVPWGVRRETAYDRLAPVWLRPPGPGDEVERLLPTMSLAGRSGACGGPCKAGRADGESGGPVGLVALVAALATACHRVRLRRSHRAVPDLLDPRDGRAQPCTLS
jgi:hypothetical protein